MKSILDRVTLGTVHQANIHDLAKVEGDQCLKQEACVTAGCPLVEMHVSKWAKAQWEDQMLSAVMNGHRSQQTWKQFWQNTPQVKKVNWFYRIDRISQFMRDPCTYTQYPKVKLKTCCSSWSLSHTVLAFWMGATKMQAIRGVTICCPCWENGSCGQVQKSIRTCMHCLQYEGNWSYVPLHPLLSNILLDLLHVGCISVETAM